MQVPGTRDPSLGDIIGTLPASRADLLQRIERWTQRRKIGLCRGLCANIVTTSEVMLAHGLTQDEIDGWMEAYRNKDFEALKIGYRRKRAADPPCGLPDR
jgi:hypothetical protein